MFFIKESDILQYVTNQIFYHFQKEHDGVSARFEVGGKYIVGRTYNPFFDYFNYFEAPLSELSKDSATSSLFLTYERYVNELIFEDVRKEFFPELPSRQKCLWLIPNMVDINQSMQYWQDHLPKDKNLQLLKLSCTGKLFIADATFLDKTTLGNFDVYRKRAFNYWSGNVQNSKGLECLFTGTIEVLSQSSSPYSG